MAFIFLKTDAFRNTIMKSSAIAKWEQKNRSDIPVRRPYRGIQIKEDTYSTIAVRHPNGDPIPLISSSDTHGDQEKGHIGSVNEYADYVLQSVQEQRMEKQQIVETFGDPYVYFFGERPRIVQFSGQLISTEDFNWRAQFWQNYDENIRGTKLVQKNARAYVSFDTIVVEGYVLNASAIDNAENPYLIQFNFSMLVTNYFDWSSIGQTEYPGFGESVSASILNLELQFDRSQFTSTGAEVRLKNLEAMSSPAGILATIRSGIRQLNNTLSMVSGLIDKVHNVIGGRVVRLPLGAAGYLRTTGAAVIAGGSAEFPEMYNPVTARYETIPGGSLKLRMPGAALFAPPWISQVTNQPRGYIFENYDEYPNRAQPEKLSELLSLPQMLEIQNRTVERLVNVTAEDLALTNYNMIAEAGSWLGDLAEAVNFVKSNFGMIMSAAAFVRDPMTIVQQSLGIGVGTTSQSRIAGRSQELAKSGIKTTAQEEANRSILERAGKWIGGSAINTFTSTATAKSENAKPASIGEVYNQSGYQQVSAEAGPGDLAYEPAYGDQNYSALVSQGGAPAQATLEEAYGNTDSPTGTDVAPASLSEVYGTGSSSSAVRSPADIAAALQQSQSTDVATDEDTSGIAGEDDVGSKIDPVV